MEQAYKEACKSFQEGNYGFGAVIVHGDEIITKDHDREKNEKDPTSHAEINVIRKASKIKGENLNNCIIVSTHEPCPMCPTAIFWPGIKTIVYGYSIKNAIKEGRRRVNISCKELSEMATDSLIKQINNKLSFARNYEKIRPYSGYREEMIILTG
jgi:tRNA(Arg) A34 adenosine deaminase TadA